MLRVIIFDMTPPTVSIPCDNGVTSKIAISLASKYPPIIAPCIAAPYATASSGLTPFDNSFPSKNSDNNR